MWSDDECIEIPGDRAERGTRGSCAAKNPKRHLKKQEAVNLQSKLANYLKEQWNFGKLSPQQVQVIAQLAASDIEMATDAGPDAVFTDLNKLAKLGTGGRYSGPMHTQMVKTFDAPLLDQLQPLHLATKTSGSDQRTLSEQVILYPHLLFSFLYHEFPDMFVARLVSSTEVLENFWNSVSSTTQYQEHPVKDRVDHKSNCIPIFLHGDGVPTTGVGKAWTKMLDTWLWGSLLVTDGCTSLTNFLIFAFWSMLAVKNIGLQTYDDYWRALCWSLEIVYTGKFLGYDQYQKSMTRNL